MRSNPLQQFENTDKHNVVEKFVMDKFKDDDTQNVEIYLMPDIHAQDSVRYTGKVYSKGYCELI